MEGARRLRRALAAFALGLAPVPPATARDFETAMELVREGQSAAAVAIFRDLARAGNGAAQINLAVMHARGDGVPMDELEASYWAWRARLMGELRAVAPSEVLISGLPKAVRNTLADRLATDFETLAEEGEIQAFMARGRVETEVRQPAKPQDGALWFTIAAAFEIEHAARLRDVTLAELSDKARFDVQAKARAAFEGWCSRVPNAVQPPSCPPNAAS